jgi:shikimate kinase
MTGEDLNHVKPIQTIMLAATGGGLPQTPVHMELLKSTGNCMYFLN